MRPAGFSVYFAAILGCATCSRQNAVASAKGPEAVASAKGPAAVASARDDAPDRSLELRIAAAVCAGRHDCQIEKIVSGGKSHLGADLYVAMARVPRDLPWVCPSHDVWLVSAVGQDTRAVHRIEQYCTHLYSSPSLEVVAPGEVRLVLEGASEGTEARGFHFALDPLKLTRLDAGLEYWDFANFRGAVCHEGTVDACARPSLTLPSVDVGNAFAAGGWRTTSLGECSMHFGPVRALVSRGVFYIEVALGAEPSGTPLQIELDRPGGPSDMEFWTVGMDGTLSLTVEGKRRPVSSEHVETVDSGSFVRRFMLTNFWSVRDREVATMHITYGAHTSGSGGFVHETLPSEATCTPDAGVLEVVHAPPNPDPFEPL
jgi:hypothetical protein